MPRHSLAMHDGTDTQIPTPVDAPKRAKGIYMLPNMITLAALFGGFYAIVMAMNDRFDLATVGIFVAMVLDSLDGRVARLTNTQSAFGEQMDSLSDMVSFGAAPALIAYEWVLRDIGRWGWIAAFVYCACAALRLARFNTNIGVVDKRFFQGLPSPAAAALPMPASAPKPPKKSITPRQSPCGGAGGATTARGAGCRASASAITRPISASEGTAGRARAAPNSASRSSIAFSRSCICVTPHPHIPARPFAPTGSRPKTACPARSGFRPPRFRCP